MLQENELVPFQATSLLGEKLLVLAPHPDDEVLGCGGVLALNASLNRQVTVLVATDGSAADGSNRDADAYRARRERETVAGLATLGIATPPRFLRLRDRELDAARSTLMTHLRETIFEVRPDLVLVPSPVEMHPDHVALAMALFDLIQSDESIRGALSIARVAFYEVSQPIRPNTIVDISTVAGQKHLAVDAHSSQQGVRDYARFIRGLNEYRTMSLPPEVTAAEGYWVTPADALRTMPWTDLCRALSPLGQPLAEVTRSAIDATVVVRTKDRHAWLRESLSSIIANRHPARIVVVNDGGESPRELIAGLSRDIDLVENERSLGRADAMNRGVQAVSTPWLAFLDDDDLFYPEHLETLAAAASSGSSPAFYTDALSVFMERGADGAWVERFRLRQYTQDFDANLLLVDNFIPLPTLLLTRANYLAVGGFDPAFDLFEDWDFLIRLSRLGAFQRIPRVTCEIRHFPASGSLVVGTPEGSPAFRKAKLAVWQKHRASLTDDAVANAFELQKRRMLDLVSRAVEYEGVARLRDNETTRLEREKNHLLDEIGRQHALYQDEQALRQNDRAAFEKKLDAETRRLGRLMAEQAEARGKVEAELRARDEELQRRNGECVSLRGMLDEHRAAVENQSKVISDLFGEIERLGGVIDAIHRSKAWKLHELLGKLTGRG